MEVLEGDKLRYRVIVCEAIWKDFIALQCFDRIVDVPSEYFHCQLRAFGFSVCFVRVWICQLVLRD